LPENRFVSALLFAIALLAVVGGMGLWWRLQIRHRQRTLTRIMDDADAVETLLRRTRDRMGMMQTVVGRMPADIAADARASLDSSDRLQAGFRDLLQHRMWLQQNVATASQGELDEASAALGRARARIAAELDRLDNAGAELESATGPAIAAAGREPPALRRSGG
jgi:DNA repair ATPase RecN